MIFFPKLGILFSQTFVFQVQIGLIFLFIGKFRQILDITKLNKTIIWTFISSYKVQCVVRLLPFFSFLFGDPICKLEYIACKDF